MIRNILIFAGLISIFLGLRLFNLLVQPLYLDEGIYIFWSKLVSESTDFAYVSLQDGKTPLYFWLIASLRGIIGDTLLAGRLISVGASVVSVFSWMVIIKNSVKFKYSNLIYLAFFAVMPLGLMTERMAFSDSLLGACVSLSFMFLYLAYLDIDHNKLWKVLIWTFMSGITLGLGYMTKTTTRLFLVIHMGVIVFWLIIFFKNRQLLKIMQLILVIIIMYFIYNQIIGFLRFGGQRFWGEIVNKENLLTFSVPEIISRLKNEPLSYMAYVPLVGEYILYYFGVTLPLTIAGFVFIVKNNFKNFSIIFMAVSIVIAVFLSGRVMASRYFYILVPVITAIITIGAVKLFETKNKWYLSIVVITWILLFIQSLIMIISPYNGVYASDDKNYYYTGEVNAYGLQDVIKYLNDKEGNSIVGVYGTWGIPEGVRVILNEHGIEAVGLSNILSSNSTNSYEKCETNRVLLDGKCWMVNFDNKKDKFIYIVGEYREISILNRINTVKLLFKFDRPNSGISTYLYNVL